MNWITFTMDPLAYGHIIDLNNFNNVCDITVCYLRFLNENCLKRILRFSQVNWNSVHWCELFRFLSAVLKLSVFRWQASDKNKRNTRIFNVAANRKTICHAHCMLHKSQAISGSVLTFALEVGLNCEMQILRQWARIHKKGPHVLH